MHTIKKLIFLFSIVFIFSRSSFAASQYGPWKSFPKLPGLYFAVKCDGYNEYAKKYTWWVKFYNGYTQDISFDFILSQDGVSADTLSGWGRNTIKPGKTGGGWNLVSNASCSRNSVSVWYDKVRFGNDWGPYYNESSSNTTWLSASSYQKFFNSQVANGYYPDNVQGRCSNGVSVFTAEWKPLSNINYFHSNHNITQSVYSQNNKNRIAAGFRLTTVNTFIDCSGIKRFQATWIK